MISGINLDETIDFISKHDKGDPKTVFKIGAIPSKVQAKIGRLIGENNEGSIEFVTEAFRFGVHGIVNFCDKNGCPILFETSKEYVGNAVYSVVSNSILDIIPLVVISDVGAKIMSITNISEQEVKN
jgi:hypothetical protein